jgi:hypothetical protein
VWIEDNDVNTDEIDPWHTVGLVIDHIEEKAILCEPTKYDNVKPSSLMRVIDVPDKAYADLIPRNYELHIVYGPSDNEIGGDCFPVSLMMGLAFVLVAGAYGKALEGHAKTQMHVPSEMATVSPIKNKPTGHLRSRILAMKPPIPTPTPTPTTMTAREEGAWASALNDRKRKRSVQLTLVPLHLHHP